MSPITRTFAVLSAAAGAALMGCGGGAQPAGQHLSDRQLERKIAREMRRSIKRVRGLTGFSLYAHSDREARIADRVEKRVMRELTGDRP